MVKTKQNYPNVTKSRRKGEKNNLLKSTTSFQNLRLEIIRLPVMLYRWLVLCENEKAH